MSAIATGFRNAFLSIGAALAFAGAAIAQDYPNRQIVIIVPFPAGGSTDLIARLVTEPMRQALGQPVLVQNVPGAGSTIGTGKAIASPPDTYIPFWQGMWAPKGTPQAVIARLNEAVAKAFADPTVQKRLAEFGQDAPTREQLTPQALAAWHKAEIDKWWPLISGANIKVE
jgi:tripartite-type tricarboxylate transporter receptor subunit TctC